jgi:asparagine synthase (glutamine-hydrolysing)
MRLRFTHTARRPWVHTQDGNATLHCCGYAELDGELLTGGKLASRLLRLLQEQQATEVLERTAGNFALAADLGGRVLLAADPVRSLPLLYALDEGVVVATDDPDALPGVTGPPGEQELDRVACAEYLAAGFVTGARTLFGRWRQVRAGECVEVGDGTLHAKTYFAYLSNSGDGQADDAEAVHELAKRHDEALLSAFRRLLRSVEGRQLVVPLSGGLDSRLVASTLKRLGRDNVLCVAYGQPKNFEAERSGKAAETLGYPWLDVRYGETSLRETLLCDAAHEFRRFAALGVSSPHLDDFLALTNLSKGGMVSPDAVFLPGHTGDFISGGHLKHLFDPEHTPDPRGFARAMLNKHFSLWGRFVSRAEVRSLLEQRLMNQLSAILPDPAQAADEELAAAYEYWEWRERQAKFIINAVRSYEWFGYGWRVPLWDREYMEFWKSVPLALKHEKYLYRLALEQNDPLGVYVGAALAEPWSREKALARQMRRTRNPRRRLKTAILDWTGLGAAVARRARKRALVREYDDHPIGIARLWERREYLGRDRDKRHSQALITREQLAFLSPEAAQGRLLPAPRPARPVESKTEPGTEKGE